MIHPVFIVGGVVVAACLLLHESPLERNYGRQSGEVAPPEHVDRARFFVDMKNGHRREVEVIEYEPNYYSVWFFSPDPWAEKSRYIGVVYQDPDGGEWKAKQPGRFEWQLFSTKQGASRWLAEKA